MPQDDYPDIQTLEEELEQHGEVHAAVEDVDVEVEFRLGTTSFDYDAGLLSVDDGDTTHHFSMASVVSWYRPFSLFHE